MALVPPDTAAGWLLPPVIKRMAPVAPATLRVVIGSLSMMAAKIMAHSGMLVVMIDASAGDVSPTPNI